MRIKTPSFQLWHNKAMKKGILLFWFLSLITVAGVLQYKLSFNGDGDSGERDLASKTLVDYSRKPKLFKKKSYKAFLTNKEEQREIQRLNSQQCVVDICGKADTVFSVSDMNEFKRPMDPVIDANYTQFVDEYLDLKIKIANKEFDLKSSIQRSKNISNEIGDLKSLISDPLKKLILGLDYYDMFNEFAELYAQTDYERINLYQYPKRFLQLLEISRVDATLTKMSLNSKDKLWFKELLISGLLLDTTISPLMVYDLELETLVKLMAPGEEYNEGLKKLLHKIYGFSQTLGDAIGISGTPVFFSTAINLYKNPDIIYDTVSLSEDLASYYIANQFFLTKYDHILSRDFDWFVYSKSILGINRDYYNALHNKDVLKEVVAEVKDECMYNLHVTLDQTNSSLKNRQFRSYLNEVLEETKKQIKFAKPENQQEFESKLANLNISFMKDLVYLNRVMSLTLRSLSFNSLHYDDLLSRGSKEPFQALLLNSMGSSNNDYVGSDREGYGRFLLKDSFKDLLEACSMYQYPTLSDRVYTGYGLTKLSWSSVRFPKYGIGVAAHEVGHYVSETLNSMSKKNPGSYYRKLDEKIPIWEERSCINELHNPKVVNTYYDTFATKNSDNETLYTEEDWSDYFGAKIIRELKPKHPWLKNFVCQMIDRDEEGNYSVEVNDYFSDIHSPTLRRLLLVQKTMSPVMPQSCQKIIDENAMFQCLR